MELIFYQNLIYGLMALVTFFYLIIYNIKKNRLMFQDIFMYLFIIAFSITFAVRDYTYLSDTGVYNYQFSTLHSFKDIFTLKLDYLFYFLFFILKKLGASFTITLFVVALIFNFLIYKALKKIFPRFFFFLFFITTSLFFYYAMATNILRQGLAFAFFLYGIACYNNDEKKNFYIFSILALGMHFSFLLPFCFFLVIKFLKNIKFFLFIYVVSFIIAVFEINLLDNLSKLPIISKFFSNRTGLDFISDANYKIGFRPDFFIFNTFFLIIALLAYHKMKDRYMNEKYKDYLSIYILLSSYFFLMFQYPFSDRYGVMSWMFLPLIFLPFIKKQTSVPFININTVYIMCIALYIVFNVVLKS